MKSLQVFKINSYLLFCLYFPLSCPLSLPQVGDGCSGKAHLIKALAGLSGRKLLEYPLNTATDTMELLGGFEQVMSVVHEAPNNQNNVCMFN